MTNQKKYTEEQISVEGKQAIPKAKASGQSFDEWVKWRGGDSFAPLMRYKTKYKEYMDQAECAENSLKDSASYLLKKFTKSEIRRQIHNSPRGYVVLDTPKGKVSVSRSYNPLEEVFYITNNDDNFGFTLRTETPFLVDRGYEFGKPVRCSIERYAKVGRGMIDDRLKKHLSKEEISIAQNISKVFDINRMTSKGDGGKPLSDKHTFTAYSWKEKLLKKIANDILEKKPSNISYGIRGGVIYFDVLERQVSFHLKYSNHGIPPRSYEKEWIGEPHIFNPLEYELSTRSQLKAEWDKTEPPKNFKLLSPNKLKQYTLNPSSNAKLKKNNTKTRWDISPLF